MEYLKFWFKTKCLGAVLQLAIVVVVGIAVPVGLIMLEIMGKVGLLPLCSGVIYCIAAVVSYELNIKDISVDGMKAADRKEEQRRVQFVATLFDWGRLILAVLTLTLLLIAVGFSL